MKKKVTIVGGIDGPVKVKKLRKVAVWLEYYAFVWDTTPQGYDYWCNVSQSFNQLADLVETQRSKK